MNGKCPKCKDGKLFVIDRGSYKEHACDKCDYQYIEEKQPRKTSKQKNTNEFREDKPSQVNFLNLFKNYFRLLNKASGILVVVLLFLMLILFSMVGEQVNDANVKINSVENSIRSKMVDTRNEIDNNISGIRGDINDINTNLLLIETNIDDLTTLCNTITDVDNKVIDIEETLLSMQDDIDTIWNDVYGGLDQTNTNLTFTYYANQTGDNRYCHVDFKTSKDDVDIEEIKLGLRYTNVNISLLNWTGSSKPQEYQWLNENITDNYYLHWFGINNNVMAKFNLTWDVSNYNTSNLPKTGLDKSLMINSILFDFPEIWEIEVA